MKRLISNHKNQAVLLGLVLGLSVFVAGCGSDSGQDKDPFVKTITINDEAISSSDTYSGTIQNKTETALSFQASGRILTKQVQVGDRVEAGQILATIDPKDNADAVRRAQAGLNSAQSQFELATTNVERYRALYAQQAVSKLQLDQMENTYNSAQASLEDAQAQLSTAQNQLNYTELTAPDSGVITALSMEAGQMVSAGQQVGTLAVGHEPEAAISIPEQMVGQVKAGTPAEVTFWALPDQKIKGVVREVTPVPDQTARTYKVKITLVDVPDTVQLGMTANVKLNIAGKDEEAITIPLTALIGNEDKKAAAKKRADNAHGGTIDDDNSSKEAMSNTKASVYVVRDGKVAKVDVTVGQFKDNSIVITSGLKKGDIVITAGTERLREGEAVRYE